MDKRLVELERWDAAHKILAEAVKRVKSLSGNEMYERAWQKAIDKLQELDSELDRRDTGVRAQIEMISS